MVLSKKEVLILLQEVSQLAESLLKANMALIEKNKKLSLDYAILEEDFLELKEKHQKVSTELSFTQYPDRY